MAVETRSYSQFSTFALCPRKWQLSRKWEPRVKAHPLAEGTLMHQALASMYAVKPWEPGHVTESKAFVDAATAAGSAPDFIRKMSLKAAAVGAMASHYEKAILPLDREQFEVLGIESPFNVRLARGLRLGGIVDGVWRDRNSGVRYIVEHKYKSDHYDELMPMDLQVSLYTLAMVEKYGSALPTLYNVIRKPLQKQKEGEDAQAFSSRVFDAVGEEIGKNGITRNAVSEFESRYFIRRIYSRGRADLETAATQVIGLAKLMRKVDRDPGTVWRNPGEHCVYGCAWRVLCMDEDPMAADAFFVKRGGAAEPPPPVTKI